MLYNEKPAIVAGFHKGFADEQKANKNSAQNDLVSKAPLCKGRDALRKYAGGIFLAKAGSNL